MPRWIMSSSATEKSNLEKLNILLNGEVVDALSLIVHKDKAYYKGRQLTEESEKDHTQADVRGRDTGCYRRARSSPGRA